MDKTYIENQLRILSQTNLLNYLHYNYLLKIRDEFNFYPKVIYDIGSCVGHWANKAKEVWPSADIYLFEAMDSVEFLYKEWNFPYHIGLLSDIDNKELIFYQNDLFPGGNSYYKENSIHTEQYFGKDSEKLLLTSTLDTVVQKRNFPPPDLMKIDVQGSEIDILNGSRNTLLSCQHLIVELQHTQYNIGALLNTESIPIIESMDFKLITSLFCNNGCDGDYHFMKNQQLGE